jgi:hypothetical protein
MLPSSGSELSNPTENQTIRLENEVFFQFTSLRTESVDVSPSTSKIKLVTPSSSHQRFRVHKNVGQAAYINLAYISIPAKIASNDRALIGLDGEDVTLCAVQTVVAVVPKNCVGA